jgi:hypothetical protein
MLRRGVLRSVVRHPRGVLSTPVCLALCGHTGTRTRAFRVIAPLALCPVGARSSAKEEEAHTGVKDRRPSARAGGALPLR